MFDQWTFPGGRLDPDDTNALSALRREMQEELSIDIEVLGELGVFYSRSGMDYIIFAARHSIYIMDYTIFAARPLDELGLLQPDEIREVLWLTPAEIYEYHASDKLQFGFEMDAVSAYLKLFT